MLALCSMLSCTYYAHFNTGIIGAALVEARSNWLIHVPWIIPPTQAIQRIEDMFTSVKQSALPISMEPSDDVN